MDLRDVSTPEQLEEYFTPEELMEATARYRASPQYSFENDELHDDEPYFYPITAIDMNGKEVLRWEEVPRDKDGNQRLAEFVRAAQPSPNSHAHSCMLCPSAMLHSLSCCMVARCVC
jgi:hypothetical protein